MTDGVCVVVVCVVVEDLTIGVCVVVGDVTVGVCVVVGDVTVVLCIVVGDVTFVVCVVVGDVTVGVCVVVGNVTVGVCVVVGDVNVVVCVVLFLVVVGDVTVVGFCVGTAAKKISNLFNKIKRTLQLRWNQHKIDDLKGTMLKSKHEVQNHGSNQSQAPAPFYFCWRHRV